VSSDESQRLDLWTNSGSGAFTLTGPIGTSYYIEASAARLVVADFDADTWPDVAWGDTDMHGARVYLNNRDGSFRLRQSVGMGHYSAKSLAAADFSGDGRVDLLSSNDSMRTFNIALGDGSGAFDAPIVVRPAQYPTATLLGDFTEDGRTDYGFLLQGQTASISLAVYAGTGGGHYTPQGIQTPYTDFEETVYRYRFQGTIFADREGFASSADYGVSFRTPFPNNYGEVVAGLYNGDTYTRADPNDQKSFRMRATVRPFVGPGPARVPRSPRSASRRVRATRRGSRARRAIRAGSRSISRCSRSAGSSRPTRLLRRSPTSSASSSGRSSAMRWANPACACATGTW
jgi:hypothetical protein